jgi:hypothetical protein
MEDIESRVIGKVRGRAGRGIDHATERFVEATRMGVSGQ